jgi:ABC-type multidrug transport system fused ATPase/permease subunit
MFRNSFNIVRISFQLLSVSDRRKLLIITLFQIFLSLLDAIAVGLIGILGALSVTGIQTQPPTGRMLDLLILLQIQNLTFHFQVAVLAFFASGLFIFRTLLSIYFIKRTLGFLALRSAFFTAKASKILFAQDYSVLKSYSKQEIVMNLTGGVHSLIVGVLGSSVLVITDFALIILMLLSIFIVEPSLAITSLILFSIIAIILQKHLGRRAENLSLLSFKASLESSQMIINIVDSFRELFLRNSLLEHIGRLEASRIEFAKFSAKVALLPHVSKYIIESAVILGVLVLTTQQILINAAAGAVGALAVFLAATSRIAPSILRLQQGLLQIRSSTGSAKPILEMLSSLPEDISLKVSETKSKVDFDYFGFKPSILVENVTFSYPDSKSNSLEKINLTISPGQYICIVGKSGTGKSTLVDLILGVSKPSEGLITISGVSPLTAVQTWPGAIALVSQSLDIVHATICQNITLEPCGNNCSYHDQVWKALEVAQLKEFVKSLENGLQTHIGDSGINLSGGEKQRLAVARALFTNPKLIVLDEATSSLDSETESQLIESLKAWKGEATVLHIAHRLSSVKNADLIYYIDNSRIVGTGTFDELRIAIPSFDKQAEMQGL